MITAFPVAFVFFIFYGERLFTRCLSRRASDAISAIASVVILACVVLVPYHPELQATSSDDRVMGMPIFFWLIMGLALTSVGMLIYVSMFRPKLKWLAVAVVGISSMWYFAWPSLEKFTPSKPPTPVVRMLKSAPKQGAIFCTVPSAPVSYGGVYIPDRVQLDPDFEEEVRRRDLRLVAVWPGEWYGCDVHEYAFEFTHNTGKRIKDIPGR